MRGGVSEEIQTLKQLERTGMIANQAMIYRADYGPVPVWP